MSPFAGPAATVEIRTHQTGCCYVEGSLHFGRLDGPSRGEFSLDGEMEDRGRLGDRKLIGVKSFAIEPGHYQLTVWERVCNGMCDNLEGPASQATAEFDVGAGDKLSIAVEFVLLEETTITVHDS